MSHSTKPTSAPQELIDRYTLEHCAELLDSDPVGLERLYLISQGVKVPSIHGDCSEEQKQKTSRTMNAKRMAAGSF